MNAAKPYGKNLSAMVERLVAETAPNLREVKRARLEGLVEGFISGRTWEEPAENSALGKVWNTGDDESPGRDLHREITAVVEDEAGMMLARMYMAPYPPQP